LHGGNGGGDGGFSVKGRQSMKGSLRSGRDIIVRIFIRNFGRRKLR